MDTKVRQQASGVTDILRRAGLRPSPQRAAIAGYIDGSRCHPSAEEIHKALAQDYPTLSMTTVYNTLYALEKAGLARVIDIESRNVRFDTAATANHGHFLCRKCGKIFDIPLPKGMDRQNYPGLTVDSVNLYLKGLCALCSEEKNEHDNH